MKFAINRGIIPTDAPMNPGECPVMKEPPVLSKETLTEQYYGQIYAYCARRLPDRESAEDAAQEVFAAFWEGPDFTDGTAALGWLYRVAKSKVGDFYRARGKRMEHEAAISPEDLPDSQVPTAAAPDEEEGILEKALRALSPEEAALFRQVWEEGISYRELAGRYGISEGALRTRISRLKKKLTEEIRRQLPFLLPFVLLLIYLNFFAGLL